MVFNMTKIKYTYLLLESDTTRNNFVNTIVKKFNNIDIDFALDARNTKDLQYAYNTLNSYDIRISNDRNPKNFKGKYKQTLEGKIVLHAAYIDLLKKYAKYDYLVVLQDDAYFINDNFEQEIENLITTEYINLNTSARLGQYMSGTIYGNMFLPKFIAALKTVGIVRPLDRFLVDGLPKSQRQLMMFPQKKIVEVKNFRSNLYVH